MRFLTGIAYTWRFEFGHGASMIPQAIVKLKLVFARPDFQRGQLFNIQLNFVFTIVTVAGIASDSESEHEYPNIKKMNYPFRRLISSLGNINKEHVQQCGESGASCACEIAKLYQRFFFHNTVVANHNLENGAGHFLLTFQIWLTTLLRQICVASECFYKRYSKYYITVIFLFTISLGKTE